MFKKKPSALKSVGNVTNTIKSTVRSKDLSEGLTHKHFRLDDLHKYGISGSIMGMAFDPVQSLMAISTDRGQIHVYGRDRVEVVFEIQSVLPIITLKFVKSTYLVAVDNKNTLMVFSLHRKQHILSYSAPGTISAIETEYSLDYLLIGLSSGATVVYDVDRCCLAPYKIGNLQKKVMPDENTSPVLSIKWHPRDFGTLLITYARCCIIYSFTLGEIKQVFSYEVPAGAPGGDNIRGNPSVARYPHFNNAIWHPNGLHIVSVHDDNSFVFWDANDGTLLQARTLFDTYVNVPGGGSSSSPGSLSPIIKIYWTCEDNPEYTSLLICGGDSHEDEGIHTFTYIDLGFTPKYSITSYDKMGEFYANPKQQKVMPIHTHASSIVDCLPLGLSSPYFNGGHDPQYILVLMDDGDLKFMSYPSGTITYCSDFFPPSLAWINPKVTCSTATMVPRNQWIGMMSSKKKAGSILHGGHPAKRVSRAFEFKSLLITGHQNGLLRIWDASQGELDDSSVLEIDSSAVYLLNTNMDIMKVSFASEIAELTYSLEGNDVLLFKFGINKKYEPRKSDLSKRILSLSLKSKSDLIDISDRAPYHLKEGFLPVSLVRIEGEGPVTAIKNSNVGFVTICYESGLMVVLDRRGPAVIFKDSLSRLSRDACHGTSAEFLITELNDDGYSSIVMIIGTNLGSLLFFKVIPEPNGRFKVVYADSMESNDSAVLEIIGLNSETGIQTFAKLSDMPRLSKGEIIPSLIITRSSRDIRIIKSNKTKLSHKSFPSIVAGGVSMVRARSSDEKYSVVYSVLQKNGEINVMSVPSLSEFNTLRLPYMIDPMHANQSVVLTSGDIIVRISNTEAGLIHIFGAGTSYKSLETDTLFDNSKLIPVRPTINTLQYFRGSKLITYEDLVLLLSGPNRPASKNPETELSWNVSPYNPNNLITLTSTARKTVLGALPASPSVEDDDEFSYKKPVRGLHHSTGIGSPFKNVYRNVTHGVKALEEQGNEYANAFRENLNESVTDTRNSMITGMLKNKFGF